MSEDSGESNFNLSSDEVYKIIIESRMRMLSLLKSILFISFLASLIASYYQSNYWLLLASPIFSFFAGIRLSKKWLSNVVVLTNSSDETVMQLWNYYKATNRK